MEWKEERGGGGGKEGRDGGMKKQGEMEGRTIDGTYGNGTVFNKYSPCLQSMNRCLFSNEWKTKGFETHISQVQGGQGVNGS